ncbi:MAG: AraC family transcriptional regulator [Clostridiales bacterium]|jgi:AraC-like DNA-binding protein|nr:AraC family transcriptional regulator [Clostridiales bacterium]
MLHELDLSNGGSERVKYNDPDFPIYTWHGKLSYFRDMAAVSHWHDDFEFMHMLAGCMSYNVNGEIFEVEEGDGLFVGSKAIHHGFSLNGSDCDFICVLINPSLLRLSPYIENSVVIPLLKSSAYHVLRKGIEWERSILDELMKLHKLRIANNAKTALLELSSVFRISHSLFEHLPDESSVNPASKARLGLLHKMVGFIQQNFADHIKLSDIAGAANVSQSSCCSIFKEYLRQSPIRYLTEYRLDKSVAMLREQELNITEIASACGFGSSSYYSETFRKLYGHTPTEHRKALSSVGLGQERSKG